MSRTSIPRAATSVAISAWTPPCRNAASARSRSACSISPDSVLTTKPGLGELSRDAGHVGARSDEHQRLRVLVGEEQVDERVDALPRLDEMDDVLDVGVRLAQARPLNVDRVALEAIGERHDVSRERCRDQVRSTLDGELGEDRLEVLAEAQIEHRVGLVEDDRRERRGVDLPALEGVAQTSWRGHDERRVGRERSLLIDVAGSAGDGCDAHSQRRIEPGQLVCDLLRELARGREDEDARAGGAAVLRRQIVEQVAHREADRDRLPRAGLRRDAQIAPFEGVVEHRLLDGSQRVVTLRGERRRERRADEVREVGPGHGAGL